MSRKSSNFADEKIKDMRLSDLQTGEKGIIVKVYGHGVFRKRIIEMGFIKGKEVDVLLNAPFKDPVKYRIMGYEVSLRHSEAAQIEVISLKEAHELERNHTEEKTPSIEVDASDPDEQALTPEQLTEAAEKKRHTINVALVGNPNCGKTSLFNFASGAHERVGNYSGVTVDAKTGYADFEDYHFELVDLPGTYSLSAYSPEELYVRRQLTEKTPDVVINVIDPSNLERNLYLTPQLIDMHVRMVVALNMFDEAEQRGDTANLDKLSELFGVPMVPTVFKTGKGVDELFKTVIQVYPYQSWSRDRAWHHRHAGASESRARPALALLHALSGHKTPGARQRGRELYLTVCRCQGDTASPRPCRGPREGGDR